MKAGRFTLLSVAAVGLACNSQSDLLKNRDGGGGGAAGSSGAAGSGGATAGGGTGGATAGTGGAAAGASGGTGGMPAPIVGMPLATFDTSLDGFYLNTSTSGVIAGNEAGQQNVYGSPGRPLPELSQDPTAGDPAPGCLKLTASFSGSCCEFVEVRSDIAGPQDWSDRVLHARARVVSGNFAGIAQLFVRTSSFGYGWSTATLPINGTWHELTLDVAHPPHPGGDWDPTHITEFGLQFHTGLNIEAVTNGPVVFQLDSFSLELVVPPPDGGAPDGPPADGAPDAPPADGAPDAPPVDAALDSAPADDGGEAQLAKDQFLTAYTNARCSYLAGCGLFTSLDACVASTSPSQYNLGYRYMLAAVDRGVATYVPSAAAACVAGIAQQPCAGTAPTSNAACGQIFVGTIPTGGTCLQSGECAPAGSEPPACVPTTSGACAAGTCAMVQVAAAGGSCAATPGVLKHCPDGQYCQSSTWTCTPLAAQGQVCVFQGAVATCQSGMFCAYDQTASGYRCIQRAPTGGACPLNDITGAPNCANLSDYCATGMGTAGMKTCAPRLSVGSSCVAGAGSCVRTAYCDGSVCRAQAGPGEVCTTAASQPGEKQCAGDLTCVQPGTTGDGGVSTPTCVLPSSGDICPPPA